MHEFPHPGEKRGNASQADGGSSEVTAEDPAGLRRGPKALECEKSSYGPLKGCSSSDPASDWGGRSIAQGFSVHEIQTKGFDEGRRTCRI